MTDSELGGLIARRIALTGPISLADFMAEALGHPRLGYYRHATPVGAAGDFTTAPEISQMFGELLGAWLAERCEVIRTKPCEPAFAEAVSWVRYERFFGVFISETWQFTLPPGEGHLKDEQGERAHRAHESESFR